MVDEEKGELHIIWDVNDIRNYATMCLEPETCQELSHEDALNILHELDREHDSSRGITWKVVESKIREYLRNKETELQRAVNYGS